MVREASDCLSGCHKGIPQGPHLGFSRVFLVGEVLTCHKLSAFKGYETGSMSSLKSEEQVGVPLQERKLKCPQALQPL